MGVELRVADASGVEVAVLDDGSIAFRGIIQTLIDSDRIAFGGAFGDVGSVRAAVKRGAVLIMDPSRSPVDDSQGEPWLVDGIAVLVVSSALRLPDVRAAVQRGTRGYISKAADVATLLAAIAAISAGNYFFDGCLSEAFLPTQASVIDSTPAANTAADLLSVREQQVLTMVARGFTHKQIASRLGLSKSTVDTYVQRIRQKLGATNKAMLTRIALESGLAASAPVEK